MKKYLLSFSLTFFSLFVAGTIVSCYAQIKFSAIPALTTLARDQALRLEFVIEGVNDVDDFTAPAFEDFSIIQGPQYGNYFSSVNGKVNHSVNVTYLLMPQKTGKLFIGPAQIKLNGKIFKSNSVTITVLNKLSGQLPSGNYGPASSLSGSTANNPDKEASDYVLRKGEDAIAKIQRNLILQVEVSKKSCFESEPIVATYKLYTRLKSVSTVVKRPSFNGFSVVELTTPESMDFQPDQLNGKPFYSTILRKVQLFPLQPGTITLEPIEVASEVRFLKAEAPANHTGSQETWQNFLDEELLTGQTEVHRLTQQSKPVIITVKPLPENGKPANFNGAVGIFSLQASLDQPNMNSSETGNLKINIEGQGNFSMINAPHINWPPMMEAFEPTARENIDNSAVPLSGIKTFEYPFTVNKKGSYIIPAVSFSYFNPETEKYETVFSKALDLTVSAASAGKKKIDFSDSASEEMKSSGKRPENWFQAIVHREWWWPALTLVLLAWIMYQWQQQKNISKAGNSLNKKKAPEKSEQVSAETIPLVEGVIRTFNTDPLEAARQALKKNEIHSFYTELQKALWSYMQQKYQLSPTSLSKKIIMEKLKADMFDEDKINAFIHVLNTCEMALYTPMHTQAERYQLLQEADTFIKTVEHKIV